MSDYSTDAHGTTTQGDPQPRRSVGGTIAIVIAILVAAVIVAGAVFAACFFGNNRNAPSIDDPTTVADLDSWTYPTRYATLVTQANFATETIDGQDIPTMLIATIPDDNNVLDLTTWPDSTGPALANPSAQGVVVRTLVYADNCAMYAIGLQGVESLSKYNKWLAEHFPNDPKKISAWAAKAVSGSDEERLHAAKECALVGALWEQLTDMGVQDNLTTKLNYHVTEISSKTVNPYAPFTTARNYELNPLQYKGQFEVLEDVEKGQPSKCENQILINTGDGRFALRDCTTPKDEGCGSSCGSSGCTGTCGSSDCAYPLNADGQCIPSKDGDTSQTHPVDKPAASNDGLKSKDTVITVISDDDSTDETAGGDGTVVEK